MNFSFYILGAPNGYNQYPADNNSTAFQEFIQTNTTESQLTVKRSGQLVYYVYMRRLQEKSSNFLGFCLVFNGVYCRKSKKLFELFDRAYFDVQLKGEFLKFDKGKSNYIISKFVEKSLEIERIKTFFKNNLEHDFIHDFTNLSPSFKLGNGHKTISIKENDIYILATISEYEIVHISNNEKSLSELERTQKMLTDLYAEKHTLQQNFNKLLAKKKQYSIIIALCFILISSGTGLFVFNINLQSKESRINNLIKEITQKRVDVKNLENEVTQLRTEKQKLTSEKRTLQDNIFKLTHRNIELITKIDQLNSIIYDKKYYISDE